MRCGCAANYATKVLQAHTNYMKQISKQLQDRGIQVLRNATILAGHGRHCDPTITTPDVQTINPPCETCTISVIHSLSHATTTI
eukprot:1426233-Karenia_brevis.AAC.1